MAIKAINLLKHLLRGRSYARNKSRAWCKI